MKTLPYLTSNVLFHLQATPLINQLYDTVCNKQDIAIHYPAMAQLLRQHSYHKIPIEPYDTMINLFNQFQYTTLWTLLSRNPNTAFQIFHTLQNHESDIIAAVFNNPHQLQLS